MFRNYLVTAWRQIANNPLYSAINIFGLSLGLMSCILILLFVRSEISHDRDLKDADRIVRLHSAFYPGDRPPFLTVRSAGRMMEAMRDYAPDEVAQGVRLVQINPTVRKGDSVFAETVVFADRTFFDVFDLPFAQGSSGTAFARPMDLVVSEEMALKYFGRTDVVGESLTVCCLEDQPLDVQITGVIRDLPDNSHLDIDFLTVMEPAMFDFAPNLLNTWTSVNVYTYFKLHEGRTAQDLKQRIWHWLDTESPFLEMVGEGMRPTDILKPNVMAVPDIYLHAGGDAGNMGDMRALGDINMVYAFSAIAVLILVIASINFMNLSTARSAHRSREVALRKVLGARRGQLALQFLGEAVTIALLALLFALVAVEMVLPIYSDAIGRELALQLVDDIPLLLGLLTVSVLVGLVSGSYPAAYLSRFLPARILQPGHGTEQGGSSRVRSILVVFQFAISIGLTVCTVVMYGQTSYARSMDLGYSVDGKLILHGLGASDARSQQDAIVEQLSRLPQVRSVVLSSEVPSQDNENNTGFQRTDTGETGMGVDPVVLNYHSVGYGFFESYDMQIVHGRGFDRQFGAEEIGRIEEGEDRVGAASIVINEAAAGALGFGNPADAVGKVLRADVFQAGLHDLTIVGVSRDVYFRSIKFGIRPTVYFNNPGTLRTATISFSTADIPDLIAEIEAVWKEMVPMTPISHEFLSDMVAAQYQDEEQQAQLFAAFSLLAVVIACLGLYGLASFTAERRTREIGIRKVLGARVRDIVKLLVWQFSLPVLIANLIAWPISLYLVLVWLEGFQYRIGDSAIVLACLGASLISLSIAWITVASRAVRVARASPVDALRYE